MLALSSDGESELREIFLWHDQSLIDHNTFAATKINHARDAPATLESLEQLVAAASGTPVIDTASAA